MSFIFYHSGRGQRQPRFFFRKRGWIHVRRSAYASPVAVDDVSLSLSLLLPLPCMSSLYGMLSLGLRKSTFVSLTLIVTGC